MPRSAKMQYLIDAVKEHARVHYERDGWDYVIETMSDECIASELRHDMWTAKQAIRIVGKSVKALADVRAEIEATEF